MKLFKNKQSDETGLIPLLLFFLALMLFGIIFVYMRVASTIR